MTDTFVTPHRWHDRLQHDVYGATDTYRLAAEWLAECATVEDWGGGSGHFARYLPDSAAYLCVDGTPQARRQVLADVSKHQSDADGILLRHVVDMTEDWRAVLGNALRSFRRRMVVITFTPDAPHTCVAKHKSGWPVRHFNPDDLRAAMGAHLRRDVFLHTTHPERVYFLERAS